MKSKNGYILFSLMLLFHIFLWGCVKDDFDPDKVSKKVVWNPDFALPLVHGKFQSQDIFGEKEDTIVFSETEDGRKRLEVVFQQDSLFAVDINDYLFIPEQDAVSQSQRLGLIKIDSVVYEESLSFWSLLSGFSDDLEDFFRDNHQFNAIIPPFTLSPAGSFNIENFSTFNYVNVDEGILYVEITNQFPVELRNLDIIIKNTSDGSIIGNVFFPKLSANETKSLEISIDGKTIRSDMTIDIINVSTLGSGLNVVFIDLDKFISYKIATKNMWISSGESYITHQNREPLFDYYEIAAGNDQYKLNQIEIKSGSVHYNAISEINTGMVFHISLPGTEKEGRPLSFDIIIDEGGRNYAGNIDLSGYTFDLDLDPRQNYNRVKLSYLVEVMQSDGLVYFNSNQSVDVDFQFEDLDLKWAKGYFGSFEMELPEESMDFSLSTFSNLDGNIQLEEPKLSLISKNSIGMPIGLDLYLTGISDQGQTQNLNYRGPMKIIPYPESFSEGYAYGIISYDPDNSDIDKLIGLPPANIRYSGTVLTNPGDYEVMNNIISDTSYLQMGLKLDFPLSFTAENLSYCDTLSLPEMDIDFIENAEIFFNMNNGFPFNVQLTSILFDSLNSITYDTLDLNLLKAAPMDESGIVSRPNEYKEQVDLDRAFFDHLIKANAMIIDARISSYDPGDGSGPRAAVIYSDYELEFQIGIRAKMNFGGEQ